MARKRKREYGAESQAAPLIAWLNDARKAPQGEKSYRRLSKLHELLLKAHLLALMFQKSATKAQEDPRFVVTAEKLREQVNAVLRQYKLQPTVQELRLGQHRWFVGWTTQQTKTFTTTIPERGWLGISYSFSEADAVMRLIDLAQNRYLPSVRRCQDCQRWFYAIRSDGKFHNRKCQQKHFCSRPAFKEVRKVYMRTYRKDVAAREQKSIARARRAR